MAVRARLRRGSPLAGGGSAMRFLERTSNAGVMAGRTPATCEASGETLMQNLRSSALKLPTCVWGR